MSADQHSYHRGREHCQEIALGKRTYPLVLHFEEVHQGSEQYILMRVVVNPRTALERQTWESVKIGRMTETNQTGCLNLKSE